MYEFQKELFETTIQTFKEELDAVRKERSEERQQFMALIERLMLSK